MQLPTLFLFADGDVRTDEGALFGADGSELSMEGTNDISVGFVNNDD